jgi:hypothetical protein
LPHRKVPIPESCIKDDDGYTIFIVLMHILKDKFETNQLGASARRISDVTGPVSVGYVGWYRFSNVIKELMCKSWWSAICMLLPRGSNQDRASNIFLSIVCSSIFCDSMEHAV